MYRTGLRRSISQHRVSRRSVLVEQPDIRCLWEEDPMTVSTVLDSAGRRRSPATMPGYHAGRLPRNKGMRYPLIHRRSRRSSP